MVAEGDLLISGIVTMEPPKYSDLPNRYYPTHARGRVWARTWRVLTTAIPLEAEVKDYTGESKRVWSVNFFQQRIKILGNTSISWPRYDKITTVHQTALPNGDALPVSITCETFREYRAKNVQVDQSAAQALLEEQLLKQLAGLIGEDGQVESTRFDVRLSGGQMEVSLTAQCLEEIGREQPGTEELGANP